MPKAKPEVVETTKELTLPERAAVALNSPEHERQLVVMAQGSKSITAITNKAGYDECHSARMALKNKRVEIQKVGKAAREDATAFSKAIIAEENRLIEIIEPEEERLEAIQIAHDKKIEDARQAEIKKEADRVEAIQKKIHGIKVYGTELVNKPAKVLQERVTEVEAIEIDAAFQEFDQVAQQAKDATLATLRAAYAERKQFEDAQEALRVQQEQLAEQQRIQAETDRIAREQREAQDLVDRQARAAEQAKIDESNRLEREAIAAERAENERQQQALAAERQRIADEAEAARIAAMPKPEPAVELSTTEIEGIAVLEEPAPTNRPTFEDIVQAVAVHFDCGVDEVLNWIKPA